MLPKLAGLGFTDSDFVGAISSGEVAWKALENRQGDFWTKLGTRCLHITWGSRGAVSLKGLGLEVRAWRGVGRWWYSSPSRTAADCQLHAAGNRAFVSHAFGPRASKVKG